MTIGFAPILGTVGLSLLAWGTAGLIALLGSLSYAELGAAISDSGGEYTYVLRVYGELAAFVYIWITAMLTKPVSLAIITVVCSEYILKPFYSADDTEAPAAAKKLVAAAIVCIITALNCVSVKWATRIQSALTGLKLVALILIGILGLVTLGSDIGKEGTAAHANFRGGVGNGTGAASANVGSFGVAVMAGLWSFDGWNNLNLVTGELDDPGLNLPRAIFIAVPLVTACYVIANVGYYAVLRLDQIADFEAGAPVDGFVTVFGKAALGDWGVVLLPLAIAMSTFSAANGSAFSGGRLVCSAAVNGDFPQWMAKLHGDKAPAPARALCVQAGLAIAIMLPFDLDGLIAIFSAAAWIFYLQAVSCVLMLRRQEPYLPRPFRVWMAVPVIFCLIAAGLVAAIVYGKPIEAVTSAIFILSGVPVFYAVRWARRRGWLAPVAGRQAGDGDRAAASLLDPLTDDNLDLDMSALDGDLAELPTEPDG